MSLGMSSYGMGMGMPQMSVDHGKGKARDIDFDAAFAQVQASLANQMEGARITEVTDDEAEQLAANLERTSLDKGKGKAAEDVAYEDASFKECVSTAFCCAS